MILSFHVFTAIIFALQKLNFNPGIARTNSDLLKGRNWLELHELIKVAFLIRVILLIFYFCCLINFLL